MTHYISKQNRRQNSNKIFLKKNGVVVAHEVTNSTSWREYEWKVISRFFKTLSTAKAGTTPTSECWRKCGEQTGNHTHIFWTCPKLTQFWEEVFNNINKIFEMETPQDF